MKNNEEKMRFDESNMFSHPLPEILVSIGIIVLFVLGCNENQSNELRLPDTDMQQCPKIGNIIIENKCNNYSVSDIEKLIRIQLPRNVLRSKMLFYTDYDDGGPDYLCALKIFEHMDVLESIIKDKQWENRGEDKFTLESMNFYHLPNWWSPLELTNYSIHYRMGAGETWTIANGEIPGGTNVVYLLYINM